MKPNDFGKRILTDQCQQIRIKDLLDTARAQLKQALIESSINAAGQKILLNRSKTGLGGTRYWFSCPICHGRVGVLYKSISEPSLGCRKCLRLDYRSHRYSKMLESNVI